MELEAHGIRDETGAVIHSKLARLMPQNKVLPLTSAVLRRTAELSKVADWRDSYFDTMIAATGLEYGADSVVSTDRKFAKLGLRAVF